MFSVMRNSWALLLGMMLLMLGNGIQGTLLGIRGKIEGFSTLEMSYVMAAYSVGFLLGSRLAPQMIQRVGHVRVFSALGSLISAVMILFPVAPDWMAWAAMRVLLGYCFAGVYISAESWLNASSTNENRGQALSAYMIVTMLGIVASQVLMNLRDPGGFDLFVFSSILVSLAFTPILLSAARAPAFHEIKPLPIRHLFQTSPLGCVGLFLLGALFSTLFGMASVWGSEVGLSVRNISIFIASIYVGGLVLQYPVGWASDRWDRRAMILWMAVAGAVATSAGLILTWNMAVLSALGFLAGGIANPLYSLLVAYVNDYLAENEMAGASAGLLFIYGLGSIGGPMATGWLMGQVGPSGFFLFIALMFLAISLYAMWRMTRGRRRLFRRRLRTLAPGASPVAVEASIGRDNGD
ncbi:MFS transporter [Tabrizicola oligotrophica]|uniref:MFS transporter n=1 Tax=Tabrizicola oligotrophica TaxID=2710650 RepID=A0A6M0QNG6_9RHOB|nr:MFS transporter [Tabrizicola oligotrophica]NEY88939.1 MFS transporter [Tabrizicola oligotrophica]